MSFELWRSLRSRVLYPLSLALSRKGRGDAWIERRREKRFDSTARREAFDVLEKHIPSPLAGEGQGEGV